MKKLMAILAIWMSIASTFAQGQTPGSIQGTVNESVNKPFDYATVTLFKFKDSALVKTTFTEKDGRFSFENVAPGSYRITVSAMGFDRFQSAEITLPGNETIKLPSILLVAGSNNLKQVDIVSKKAFVERKIDRTVVNVDALISNAGSTALDVLEKSPGITVDQNGTISLKGKQGAVIFIDDKPTYLSGGDLQSYLQSLPASALEQVEIMTNPPAKYDAAGNAGVINIKTKKGKVKGFNGAVNLGLSQGKMTRSNNSLNFNYRDNKLNLFGTVSDNLNNSFSDLTIMRRYKNADESTKSIFDQRSYFKRHGNTLNGKIGADYYATEKTTWGIVLTGMTRNSKQTNDNTSNLLNAFNKLDSMIVAKNSDIIDFKNGGVNLNFRHQFDKSGQELTIDGDYLNYKNQTDQVYDNFSYLPDGKLKTQDRLTGSLPAGVDIYSLKTDYTKPMASGWKFESGLKSSFIKTDNTVNYFNTVNAITKPDYEKSNHFIYKENINAGYLNLSREGKRLSMQLGLRLENTVSDGHQYGNAVKPDSAFRRTYTGLFPTAYLSYKLDSMSNNQIGLNYGRRIDRPYYQDLNPFLSPLDKFTFYVGNPFLRPAYTNSVELSHTYKNFLTTTLSYSSTKDEVNETIEIVNGTYFSRPGNIGKSTLKSISVDGNGDLTKWLNAHIFVQVAQTHSVSDFYTGPLDTKGIFYYIGPTFQFKLPSDWSAELAGSYQSKVVNAQFIAGAVKQVRIAVMKKLSASTSIKLNVNDIFYTRVNSGVINNLALTDASYRNLSDSRFATLSLNYRFGKSIADQRKHDAAGAQDEQNRVKN
ncbi:outer membrane beta-barrel protein [Pedobacter duraquae]|uniref:Outer membrane receptor protein involved in Fe transport n=1 Tax=Pedobacter duraquae TaxID=425511 RepID=A0A4R6IK01_9SPHI|nr:outer membrane beta-barrel protein [Pedobacter duraquae]TDO22343.1 outer membrane receptor protein involved in Fe transport [Pedobacter duraquae]